MNKPKKVLTMREITDWMVEFSPVTPTHDEVESAVYSLIEKGVLEPLWNSDGTVSYRLTKMGDAVAEALEMMED